MDEFQGFIAEGQRFSIFNGNEKFLRYVQQVDQHAPGFWGGDQPGLRIFGKHLQLGSGMVLFGMMSDEVVDPGDAPDLGHELPGHEGSTVSSKMVFSLPFSITRYHLIKFPY